jgi:hypothetical protein
MSAPAPHETFGEHKSALPNKISRCGTGLMEKIVNFVNGCGDEYQRNKI